MNDLLEIKVEPVVNTKRSLESIAKQSRSMKIVNAKKRCERPVNIAIDLMSAEIGVEAMSQKQLHSILIKRYLDGSK